MPDRISVQSKLVAGLGVIVLLFGLLTAITYFYLLDTQRSHRILYLENLSTVSDLAILGSNLNAERLQVSLMLDAAGRTISVPLFNRLQQWELQDERAVARLTATRHLHQDATGAARMKELIALRRGLMSVRDTQILPLLAQGRDREARRLFAGSQLGRYVRIQEILRDLQSIEQGEARTRFIEVEKQSRSFVLLLLAMGAVSLSSAGTIILAVRNWLAAELRERGRAEAAAQEADARLLLLAGSAAEAILVFDPDSDRVIEANQSAEELLQSNREQLLASALSRFFLPEPAGENSLCETQQDFIARAVSGEAVVIERSILGARGRVLRCEVRLCRIPGKSLIRVVLMDVGDASVSGESQWVLSALLQTTGDGLVLWDGPENLIRWNISAERLFGAWADDHSGKSFAERFLSQFGRDYADLVSESLSGKPLEPIESGRICSIGSRISLSIRHVALRDPRGKFVALATIARDVTEFCQAKKSLAMLERQLAATQRIATIGSWALTLDTGVLLCSDELYRIADRKPAQAARYDWLLRLFDGESASKFDLAVKSVSRTQPGFELELLLIRPDNGRRWVVVRGLAILDTDGSVVELHGTIQDITERKETDLEMRRHREAVAEQISNHTRELVAANQELKRQVAARERIERELRESESRFRALLENSLDVPYQRDLARDRYDYVSPAIERLLGISSLEFASFGHDEILDRTHPEDREAVSQEFDKIIAGQKQSGRIEYRFRGKDDVFHRLADNYNVIRSQNGTPRYLVGNVRDITEPPLSMRKHQ